MKNKSLVGFAIKSGIEYEYPDNEYGTTIKKVRPCSPTEKLINKSLKRLRKKEGEAK